VKVNDEEVARIRERKRAYLAADVARIEEMRSRSPQERWEGFRAVEAIWRDMGYPEIRRDEESVRQKWLKIRSRHVRRTSR
jgi:hypothetical protein